MEKEGFVRVMENLQKQITVRAVSTDRHIQIKKLMESDIRFANIVHQFDPWHVAKNISKQLVKASKYKGKKILKKLLNIFIKFNFKIFRLITEIIKFSSGFLKL